MARVAILVYGVLVYGFFLGVFVYAIGFIGGFLTPTSLDAPARHPIGVALAIDLALLGAFAVQHSGMARPAFKRWWTRWVPPAAERSTYVLLSAAALLAMFVWWQPIEGEVWRVPEGVANTLVLGVYLAGWALLLYSTFLIDHFDLFGLKQVWRHWRGQPYREPEFRTPALYRWVRHPLYVGWLMIFWAAPVMTLAHLVFAVATTAYILIAIRWEERDLTAAFGERYLAYWRATPMLVPGLRQRARTEPPIPTETPH